MKTDRIPFQHWLTGAATLLLTLSAQTIPAKEPGTYPEFQRILFLGNSITRHGPKAAIGWSGNWGMAASSQQNDYVHLVLKSLSKNGAIPPQSMIRNIAGFERDYATHDLTALLKEVQAFKPDLIILAIGENVPKLNSADAEVKFADSTRQLLKSLQHDKKPVIVIRSCFWANQTKDRILRQLCEETSGIFVDISHLDDDELNYARSEREFSHKGVAAHPGDQGMRKIAEAILAALKE